MNWRKARSIVAMTGLLVMVLGVPASATTVEDEGLWYFDRFFVQSAHDEGITGKGVTIAVIDSQVNLEIPTLADADIRVQEAVCIREDGTRPPGTNTDYDLGRHGTGVLSVLVGSGKGYPGQTGVKGIAPDATVLTYYAQLREEHDAGGKCPGTEVPDPFSPGGSTGVIGMMDEMAASIHAAIDEGADIISISRAGPGGTVLSMAVARALYEGVIIVAAVPNEGVYDSGTSPGSNNGVVEVNLFDADGMSPTPVASEVAVVGPGVDILHQGARITGEGPDWQTQTFVTGTSLATPIVAGNLALAMQKYPDATGNQLIQSLIHNTPANYENQEPIWEPAYGYGAVITDMFLAVDPTVYPDVNPLVYNFKDSSPAPADIWQGAPEPPEVYSHEVERPWVAYTPEPGAPRASFGIDIPDDDLDPALEPDPEPTPEPDPEPTPTSAALPAPPSNGSEQSSPGWLIPSVIIGLVLLVGLGGVITVVVIRSNRVTGGPHGSL